MTVRRFEYWTKELTAYERDVLLPALVKGLKLRIGKEMAITSGEAMSKMKEQGYKISGARWRKLLHVIRCAFIIERLVASGKGYYISNDVDDLNDYIGSLNDRIDAQIDLRDSLKEQTDEFRRENQT